MHSWRPRPRNASTFAAKGSAPDITHLSEDSLVAVLTLTFCVFILLFLLSGG
jgi:hypothetical protein